MTSFIGCSIGSLFDGTKPLPKLMFAYHPRPCGPGGIQLRRFRDFVANHYNHHICYAKFQAYT